MATVERICPHCGATNAADRTRCIRCNTNLMTLAPRRRTDLPALWSDTRTAGLVIGISALVARAGINLLARGVLPKLMRTASRRAPAVRQPGPDARPDYIISGWRTWSVQRGDEHASGSEQFEWRIRQDKGSK